VIVALVIGYEVASGSPLPICRSRGKAAPFIASAIGLLLGTGA
jgi:hypothetical protein